ncbi:hypothetical protein EVAR_18611_1 [Eumeta japonica]|uniref:Mos1 transposase HTH domain-containing protein n=1 Tax=Eumeta variegata TaxID=151549 RepID=A0A4C1V3K7_EUMVA|nr:hypothetical protein EVAR_18611_1 [Eumeta japonica]
MWRRVAMRKRLCDSLLTRFVSEIVAQNWFKRFQSSNFDVKEETRSGRPVTDKVDAILEENRASSAH